MYLYRIVTFMVNIHGQSPQHMLEGGSRVIWKDDGRRRVFTVRKVFYDDNMTPLYSEPTFVEPKWTSLQELKKIHPHKIIWDSPILDKDNYLKVWNCDNELISLNHDSNIGI
jgi:hypothetical protein